MVLEMLAIILIDKICKMLGIEMETTSCHPAFPPTRVRVRDARNAFVQLLKIPGPVRAIFIYLCSYLDCDLLLGWICCNSSLDVRSSACFRFQWMLVASQKS